MTWNQYLYAAILLLIGLIIARLASKKVSKIIDEKFQFKNSNIIRRLLFYGIACCAVLCTHVCTRLRTSRMRIDVCVAA